ncbi:MAG: MBL fold metallo-hydrolase, partial [Gammaproteobacteria bacterium]|nr:MBL fold metallo-hydrolase [Gammaproteobacteria bacterium]
MQTKSTLGIPVTSLGQTGFRLQFDEQVLYIDPYLSNYVEEQEGPELARMKPITVVPENITDANWVLITHEHMDHCDPQTLVPLSKASPDAKFLAPAGVCVLLQSFGISSDRIVLAQEQWVALNDSINVLAVPAAHPTVERNNEGHLLCVGYLIGYKFNNIYHSGDTSIDDELLSVLKKEGGASVALVSLNEKNFYRDKAGIIGNMSVRDAFQFAEEMG